MARFWVSFTGGADASPAARERYVHVRADAFTALVCQHPDRADEPPRPRRRAHVRIDARPRRRRLRRDGDGRAADRPGHEGRDGGRTGDGGGGAARIHGRRFTPAATTISTPAAPAATARARSTSARPRPSSRRAPAFRWSSTATARRRAASGSADVLAALGVTVEGDAALCAALPGRVGMAFCFAPHFHPALQRVAGVRRRLGVRTLFNWLGPLANPARAPYQLLGVGRAEQLDRLAGALARLGTRHALLVCGRDGLGRSEPVGADAGAPGPRWHGTSPRSGRRPISAWRLADWTSCARTGRRRAPPSFAAFWQGPEGPALAGGSGQRRRRPARRRAGDNARRRSGEGRRRRR